VPVLRLRSVTGARRGEEFVFAGPRVRIGRSRDNDLILPDRDVPASSGHHAEALLDASGTWWIVDAGSANGTRVNDIVVTRHALKSGDRLTMGGEQFAVGFGTPVRSPLAAALIALALLGAIAVVVILLRRSAPPTFEAIGSAAAQSVFLIAVEQTGSRSIVGTAFAIDRTGWLATNAHIADMLRLKALAANTGSVALAIRGDSYETHRIVGTRIHRGWRQGSLQDDVALVRLDPAPAGIEPLRLADRAAIASLRRGTPVAAFGFPAVSTDAGQPRGRLSVDVIGDVRGDYLEVGLGIAPGSSGSPVFDRSGAVVAIVVGGDFVGAPGRTEHPSGTAANWALSVTALKDLLSERESLDGRN